MTIKEMVTNEIETLPESRQADVLAFIRFIKVGLADEAILERQFDAALAQARALAAQRSITELDVIEEVQAVRAGQ